MKMPWNRNKTSSTGASVPKEVEDYYESTRRERVGMAWLLSLVTLILTIIIAVAIFFAGRWIYQRVFNANRNNDSSSEQTSDSGQDQTNDNPSNQSPSESTTDEESNANPDQASDSSESTDSQDDSVQTPAPRNSTVPGTGTSEPEIPNTGPGDFFY